MGHGITQDAFLDGKVTLFQPQKGFRAGMDSVFLASSVVPNQGDKILDVGCGVGTVGILLLSLWAKEMSFHVTGVEKIESAKKLAEKNGLLNHVESSWAVLKEDVLNPSGLLKNKGFNQVITNPPFYQERQEVESLTGSESDKRQAKSITAQNLSGWMDFCIKRLFPGGTLTLIIPPERVAEILDVMNHRVGRIRVVPLWDASGGRAKRLLIQGVKDAHTPLVLLSGMGVRDKEGGYTSLAEKILRTGKGFSWE